jgi:hypothetical protein
MPKIYVDISEVAEEFNLSSETVDQIVESSVAEVTQNLYNNWQQLAKKDLKSTRNQYVNGLIIADKGRFAKSIVLTGRLNNMIESGCPPFNMKDGFQKSPKAKVGKNGNWYLTIPFRLAIPGSVGEDASFNGGVMPKEIYGIVSKKNEKVGLKYGEIPKKFQMPQVRKALPGFGAYTHKSSLYEGLQKRTDSVTGQNKYMLFRRVSANSDPMSWIHAGFTARNFAQKTIQTTQIDTIIDNNVDLTLKNLGY